jgi:hypothetical protein
LLLLLGAFALSRAAAYAAGVRFDSAPLGYFWQIIDPELLRTRLLESLFYLHAQPPLFNAYLGAVLKLFPVHFEGALQAVYLGLGLVQAVGVYLLLCALGFRRWTSAIVAAALSVTPAALIYENWLFYEYPTVTLLVLSALALHRFLVRGTILWGACFFGLLATVMYLRSFFQVAWLLLVIALLLLTRPDRRRATLLTGAGAAAVVLLLIGKNLVVFGVPTTSSWFGMNLAEVVYSQVPRAERERLVERGELSRVSLLDPFSDPSEYLAVARRPPERGVPVLDRLTKTSGRENMNNEILIGVSRDYAKDSLRLIRRRPAAYAKAVVYSGGLYLQPSTETPFVTANRSQLGWYGTVFDRAVLLQPADDEIGWAILAVHTAALLYGLVLAVRLLNRRVEATATSVTLAYVWLTLAYVTIVVALTQVMENERMRYLVDPLALVLFAAAVRETAAWRASRRRGGETPAAELARSA